jgi:hypothetical protein
LPNGKEEEEEEAEEDRNVHFQCLYFIPRSSIFLDETLVLLVLSSIKVGDVTPKILNSGVGARRPLPGNGSLNTA